MTIRTKEARVETDLPPAKLYLDDIAEIVHIFSHALPNKQDSTGGVASIVTKFDVGAKQCDDIEELPKIAKKTTHFELEVSRGSKDASLSVTRYGASWSALFLDRTASWEMARKLEAVFEQRQRRVRKLIGGKEYIPFVVSLLFPFVLLIRNPNVEIFVALALIAFQIIWFTTLHRHTV